MSNNMTISQFLNAVLNDKFKLVIILMCLAHLPTKTIHLNVLNKL